MQPAGLGVDALAGVAEGSGGRGARAVRQVAHLGDDRRGGIHRADDRALDVRDERRASSGRDVHLVERVVRPEPIGEPALHRPARAVVFENLTIIRVGDEQREGAVHGLGFAPPLRVIGVARRDAGPARRSEPVLRVIAVGEGAVEGEVAVAVIDRRHRRDGAVLVERVHRVADRGGASLLIASVRLASWPFDVKLCCSRGAAWMPMLNTSMRRPSTSCVCILSACTLPVSGNLEDLWPLRYRSVMLS